MPKEKESGEPYHGLIHPKFRDVSREDFKCFACGSSQKLTANDGTLFHVCPGGAGDPVDTFGGSDF